MRHTSRLWVGAFAATLLVAASAEAGVIDLSEPGATATIRSVILVRTDSRGAVVGPAQQFRKLRAVAIGGQVSPGNADRSAGLLSVPASEVGTVEVSGRSYHEIGLEFERSGRGQNDSPLVLEKFTVFGSQKTGERSLDALGTPAYDLSDDTGASRILIDKPGRRGHRAGAFRVLIPNAGAAGQADGQLYIYWKISNEDGASVRWVSRGRMSGAPVPEPSSIIITLLGVGCVSGLGLRRALRNRMAAEEKRLAASGG
jgi:hypothetical protein